MSTRGAFGFRINNKDKITYKHMDSYPDDLGREILDFINISTIEQLSQVAQDIILVDNTQTPSKFQIESCKKWSILSTSNENNPDWYCLLRKAQGKLDPYIQGLNYMMDSSDFLCDSLYCEYAYIIDIDSGFLEVYSGYVQKPYKTMGRYADKKSPTATGFYGVVLVAKYPLKKIISATSDKLDTIITDMESKISDFHYAQQQSLAHKVFA